MRGAAFTILHHPSTLRTYITIVFIKPQSKRSGIIHSLVTFVSCNYISNLVNSLSFIFARTHDSIPIVFIRPINEQWMKKIWSPSCSNKSEKMLSYTVFFQGRDIKSPRIAWLKVSEITTLAVRCPSCQLWDTLYKITLGPFSLCKRIEIEEEQTDGRFTIFSQQFPSSTSTDLDPRYLFENAL